MTKSQRTGMTSTLSNHALQIFAAKIRVTILLLLPKITFVVSADLFQYCVYEDRFPSFQKAQLPFRP